MKLEELYKRQGRKVKIFHFDLSDRCYSNTKGYIGELIGAQFLAKHFNVKEYRHFSKITCIPRLKDEICEARMELPNPIIFPHQIIEPVDIKPEDIELVSKQFYKENKDTVTRFLTDLTVKHRYRQPDMLLSIEGKIYIVEVKMNKAEVKAYQMESYEMIKEEYGYPIIVLYITMNSFTDYTIEMVEF